jgi:tetratricopeptide (TPR) repeat protein
MPVDSSSPAQTQDSAGAQVTTDSLLREAAAISDPGTGVFPQPPRLEGGELLSDRFVIDRLAGSGGMGAVYRALDRLSGEPVAVKIMARRRDGERFAQEALALAGLSHPCIVRYVSHGVTAQGLPYLAMEWLDGEDLGHRIARTGLSVAECLDVALRIAEGLSTAHAQGVVHRDVKPSNVVLVNREAKRSKLLDFGIVRMQASGLVARAPPMTRTGVVLGTVGYMSPEQATGDRQIDARADVFALGCVLFECLTGEPAFSGAQVVAVLAKVLRGEVPRLRERRPELPAKLDGLVARMLSKDRDARPADGAAVLAELKALGTVADGLGSASPRVSAGLSIGEQRLMSVMLASAIEHGESMGAIVQRHGGELTRLANGAWLVTLGGFGSTAEHVVRAAACALELRDAMPLARIALAAGRAQATGAGPPGPLIDRAASLLAGSTSSGIRIDEITAGLLGERFDTGPDAGGSILLRRRRNVEAPRTLLGKPTPFVGRDKELALLDATWTECIDESVTRAVLVTGLPGYGKSRLRHEFVLRLRRRGEGFTVLAARGEPASAGSALMMARQLIRHATRLREGEPAANQRASLAAHVALTCKSSDVTRIADFLGEIIDLPPADDASPQLRAARNDPRIMAEWLRRSFRDWLVSQCAGAPLLLVLEDLQWGDLPSLAYVGDALRSLESRAVMALAFARPEVWDTFPNLWPGMDRLDVALARLPKRAAERLAETVLGERASADAIKGIVKRADGNAFYLEELLRRVVEGGAETLPETVLALVQSRLERLEVEARRLVRAASVFGDVFWHGGVAALIGVAADDQDVDAWLRALAEREVFAVVQDSRFPDQRQYEFRHGLLREAAYATLTDSDRARGHRLAGEWLEQVGESDAVRMGDHFERGGERSRAVPWLVRGAQTAYEGSDFETAIALACRGLACDPGDADRGLMLQVQGQALAMRGDLRGCVEMVRAAMDLLPAGSTRWFACVASLFLAGTFLRDPGITAPLFQAIVDPSVRPKPSGPYGVAVYAGCLGLAMMGHREAARSVLARAEALETGESKSDPVFVTALRLTRAALDIANADLGSAVACLSEARILADLTGDALGHVHVVLHAVGAMTEAGSFERAESAYRELLSIATPLGSSQFSNLGALSLAQSKLDSKNADESVAALRVLLDQLDPMWATFARGMLGHALFATGDMDGAVREATMALEDAAMFPGAQATALGCLALVALRRGQPDALTLADRGLDAVRQMGSPRDGSILRLARAEALSSLGRADEARAALREARDRVLRIAATLEADPDLRRSYLTNIGANARTLDLAAQWLGSVP